MRKTALFMAKLHHAGHNRRFTQVAYYTHPQDVANVIEHLGVNLVDTTVLERLVCAALLHDTLEDSVLLGNQVSAGYAERRMLYKNQLRAIFGCSVLNIVQNVTLQQVTKERNRAAVITNMLENVKHWDTETCCVKLADICCNLRDYPTDKRKRPYVREKAKQVAAIYARLESIGDADATTRLAYRLLSVTLSTFDRYSPEG